VAWLDQGDVAYCLCLGCEAIASDLAATLRTPKEGLPVAWQAGTLLLGRTGRGAGADPLLALPLGELCCSMCFSRGKPAGTVK